MAGPFLPFLVLPVGLATAPLIVYGRWGSHHPFPALPEVSGPPLFGRSDLGCCRGCHHGQGRGSQTMDQMLLCIFQLFGSLVHPTTAWGAMNPLPNSCCWRRWVPWWTWQRRILPSLPTSSSICSAWHGASPWDPTRSRPASWPDSRASPHSWRTVGYATRVRTR